MADGTSVLEPAPALVPTARDWTFEHDAEEFGELCHLDGASDGTPVSKDGLALVEVVARLAMRSGRRDDTEAVRTKEALAARRWTCDDPLDELVGRWSADAATEVAAPATARTSARRRREQGRGEQGRGAEPPAPDDFAEHAPRLVLQAVDVSSTAGRRDTVELAVLELGAIEPGAHYVDVADSTAMLPADAIDFTRTNEGTRRRGRTAGGGEPVARRPVEEPTVAGTSEGGGDADAVAAVADLRGRLAERHASERRATRRRHWRRRSAVAGIAVVFFAPLAALFSPLFAVKRVDIIGGLRTSANDIRERTEISQGMPLVRVDLGDVRRRLRAMPWIDQVSVRRNWPNGVAIEVTERTPVAAAGVAGRGPWSVLDAAGRVLERGATTGETVPAGLIAVNGPGALPNTGEQVSRLWQTGLDVVTGLDARVAPFVRRVNLSRNGRVELELSPIARSDASASLFNGGQVKPGKDGQVRGRTVPVEFGSAHGLVAKHLALLALIEQVGLSRIAAMDLSVPEAPVLTEL